MRVLFPLLLGFLLCIPQGRAQDPAAGEPKVREEIDTKGAITVILLSGLGGAVLGLSTLSFYKNPQRHLSNISIGAAVAVVGAAIFVTYKAAVGRNVKVNFEGAENLNGSLMNETPGIMLGPETQIADTKTSDSVSFELLRVEF